MNVQTRITDFARQDFLLVEAPQDVVLRELAMSIMATDAQLANASSADFQPPFWLRIVGRLLGLGPAMDRAAEFEEVEPGDLTQTAYTMFTGPAADGPPLSHSGGSYAPASMEDFAEGWDDIRISTVDGRGPLTLIEYREMVSGMSTLGIGLSDCMKGRDVLYFRRSGAEAEELHWDFHVMRGAELRRRVLCHATRPMGDASQEWWEGIMDGEQSAYEPEGLYDGVEREDEVLDAAKLDRILGTLGTSADRLVGAGSRKNPVLFSRRPGGEPLPL